jgi:hypothetical protein
MLSKRLWVTYLVERNQSSLGRGVICEAGRRYIRAHRADVENVSVVPPDHGGEEFLGQEKRGEQVRFEGDAVVGVRALGYGPAAGEPSVVDCER